ncbi:hypothetical protein V2J09_003456 [Rumex salicifolius]
MAAKPRRVSGPIDGGGGGGGAAGASLDGGPIGGGASGGVDGGSVVPHAEGTLVVSLEGSAEGTVALGVGDPYVRLSPPLPHTTTRIEGDFYDDFDARPLPTADDEDREDACPLPTDTQESDRPPSTKTLSETQSESVDHPSRDTDPAPGPEVATEVLDGVEPATWWIFDGQDNFSTRPIDVQESYLPDRCLRQFGYPQGLPAVPIPHGRCAQAVSAKMMARLPEVTDMPPERIREMIEDWVARL